jgi:hypothetical protein
MRYHPTGSFWDIRVHPNIIAWRKACVEQRIPYYWKLDVKEAQDFCDLLAESYKVTPPKVRSFTEEEGKRILKNVGNGKLNGCYFPTQRTMWIHSRAHIKTVVHEFYHHLDSVTEGKYDSDDHPDGSRGRTTAVSLAWQFADRFWAALVLGLTGGSNG